MKLKTVVYFVSAAALLLLAAGYRFYDSSHSMGLIHTRGGRVLHPLVLDADRDFYSVIATATVLAPYRGDAEVVLEGSPEMTYALYNSGPAVDLGLHRRPGFEDGVFYGLQPGDRLAFWLVMRPEKKGGPAAHGDAGCCMASPAVGRPGAGKRMQAAGNGAEADDSKDADRLVLSFYDAKTRRPVLRIPVIFRQNGAESHGRHAN